MLLQPVQVSDIARSWSRQAVAEVSAEATAGADEADGDSAGALRLRLAAAQRALAAATRELSSARKRLAHYERAPPL